MKVNIEEALNYHSEGRKGKIEVIATKPCLTSRDLSLAYTPGVAEPCRVIAKNEEEVYHYFQTNPDLNQVDMANNMAIMAIGRIQSSYLGDYLPNVLASQSEFIRLLGAQSILLLTN